MYFAFPRADDQANFMLFLVLAYAVVVDAVACVVVVAVAVVRWW